MTEEEKRALTSYLRALDKTEKLNPDLDKDPKRNSFWARSDKSVLKDIKKIAKTQGISLLAAGGLLGHRAGKKLSRADQSAAKQAAQKSRKSKGMKLSDLTTPSKDTLKKATDKVAAKRAADRVRPGPDKGYFQKFYNPVKTKGLGDAYTEGIDAPLQRNLRGRKGALWESGVKRSMRRKGDKLVESREEINPYPSPYMTSKEKARQEAASRIKEYKAGERKEVENILAKKAGKPAPHPKAKAPAKAVAAKGKAEPKAVAANAKAPAEAAKPGPKGDMMGVYSRALAKTKAPAKTASLKGAPRPELPKKSDPEYKAKLSKFRKWYTANRAKPKKKAVLTKAAPAKVAPAKAAPAKAAPTSKRSADLTGLQKRIEMKRKTGQRIPKSWLKAERDKAKAEREKDLKVTKENLAEVQRGRKEMAERKSRIAAANMKVTKENLAEVQRGRKEMSERKARVSADASRRRAQRLAQLDPLVEARQKAEVARGKTEAQERVARMRKDAAERAKRKKMQADLKGLRFRR